MITDLNVIVDETVNRRKAEDLIDNCDALPGVSRAVALNLLIGRHDDRLMTYLLGVADALSDRDPVDGSKVQSMRRAVRDLLRGR